MDLSQTPEQRETARSHEELVSGLFDTKDLFFAVFNQDKARSPERIALADTLSRVFLDSGNVIFNAPPEPGAGSTTPVFWQDGDIEQAITATKRNISLLEYEAIQKDKNSLYHVSVRHQNIRPRQPGDEVPPIRYT